MNLHLTNLVPDQIIKALCGTLLHSLWQGLILAIITGVMLMLTKKSGAALRYNLMIGFLLLFTAVTTITFFIELNSAQNQTVEQVISHLSVQPVQLIAKQALPVQKSDDVITTGISYFTNHANVIVLIWFLIICARCVQFAAGLQHIYFMKRNRVLEAGAYLENKLNKLASKIGINKTVGLLQSGIAKLPMVLGHFKPVILIPIGLLTALSEEEIEAILIHELAHIRRKDYLINLLQSLMEILFFFNPAVLWLSALIKAERENCCDDIVVEHISSKVNYIKALVSCEEYSASAPAFAMGLGGNNGHFLGRVKRILSNNNQTLNRVEKMILTICLITSILLTAAFSNTGKANETNKPKAKSTIALTIGANNVPVSNKAIVTGKNAPGAIFKVDTKSPQTNKKTHKKFCPKKAALKKSQSTVSKSPS